MATEILLPQLGMYMFEATIVRWIAAEGAQVQRGDALVEIQTDKIVTTVEAALPGRVQRIAPEGAVIPVRGLVGYLLVAGESPAQAGGPEPARVQPEAPRVEPARPAPPRGEIQASPIARRLAKEHGVDLAEVGGSGPGGRIGEKDVLAAVEARRAAREPAPAVAPPAAPAAPAAPVPVRDAPRATEGLSGVARSAQTVARVTLFTEVDATDLADLAARLEADLKRREDLAVSVTDLFIAIAGRALREHRLLNSTVDGGQIRLLPQVHIGLAVEGERGPATVVVRDADTRGLLDIVRDARALLERARAATSLPGDLSGATFTLIDLGEGEIDGFTPIVALPACAALGLGRIQDRPAVRGGQVCVRRMMTLSLSFDHRIVDGAPAARFLQRVKQMAEDPTLLLATGG